MKLKSSLQSVTDTKARGSVMQRADRKQISGRGESLPQALPSRAPNTTGLLLLPML